MTSDIHTDTSTSDRPSDFVEIGDAACNVAALPSSLIHQSEIGLVTTRGVSAQLIVRARWRDRGLFECRATITPTGDYLVMYPDGGHYGGQREKINDMLACRSKDRGRTWQGPTVAFDIDYNQHGFVPLIPRGGRRIYAFGTQPVFGLWDPSFSVKENAPIGYRYSDDDGDTWSEVRIIRPINDPGFLGMSVIPMCETNAGTWLLSAHEGNWSYKPLITRQYLLRSEDRGKTWELLPDKRHGGWHTPGYGRMDELRPINLGGGNILALARTPEGHLWELRSQDDGKTWTPPRPTPLVHPEAPPMAALLNDGKTLAVFHHNRHSDRSREGFQDNSSQRDRSQLWISISADEGHTWSEPRFLLTNALAEGLGSPWRDHQCSYVDAFADGGLLHLFMPHRWERVLHVTLAEGDLDALPTQSQLLHNMSTTSVLHP